MPPAACRIAYSVTATLPDEATAREYLAWLKDGHLDMVLAGGATSAMIVRLDPAATGDATADTRPRVETRYEFASRAAFERYVERHAPALRAEGLAKFPPARGITFERRVGEIL